MLNEATVTSVAGFWRIRVEEIVPDTPKSCNSGFVPLFTNAGI